MPPAKPTKPVRRPTSTSYRQVPIEESTAGQLFRVRDKDWEALHGENLTHEAATKLKEQVVTRGKSRTARVENMEVPPPDWYLAEVGEVATGNPPTIVDQQLELLRQKAKAASRTAAQTAQQRHAASAARDRSSGAAAIRAPRPVVPPRPVPVISTEEPTDDADASGIGDGDLHDLMVDAGSDQPSEADLARAKAAAEKDAIEITVKAKALYDAQKTDGHVPWEKLGKASQAGWRFEALNGSASSDVAEPDAEDPAASSPT